MASYLSGLVLGDYVFDVKYGWGEVDLIKTTNVQYPIRIHFIDKQLYAWYNFDGMQYKNQQRTDITRLPRRMVCKHCGCEE